MAFAQTRENAGNAGLGRGKRRKLNDERYTLDGTKSWCLNKVNLSQYTLDVAACKEAHLARHYYDIQQDGLVQPWWGHVWCNPPWTAPGSWVRKAWVECRNQLLGDGLDAQLFTISMLLPANRTEQPWWHSHVERFRDGKAVAPLSGHNLLTTHNLEVRQKFGNSKTMEPKGFPPYGVVLLFWDLRKGTS